MAIKGLNVSILVSLTAGKCDILGRDWYTYEYLSSYLHVGFDLLHLVFLKARVSTRP